MTFIEFLAFTRRVTELLTDDEYSLLQRFLFNQPRAGNVIQRTAGARKLRWRKKGQGKRGGLRLIYFHQSEKNTIWMIALYGVLQRFVNFWALRISQIQYN